MKMHRSKFSINFSQIARLPGIVPVDVVGRDHWQNSPDTAVFTAPCPNNLRDFDKWLQIVSHDSPDEYDTVMIDGSMVWRFWWD